MDIPLGSGFHNVTKSEYEAVWTEETIGTNSICVGREILPADLRVKDDKGYFYIIGYVIVSPGGFRYFLRDKGHA